MNLTLFVSSAVKKNEGEQLENLGLSNYKHQTVSVIQNVVTNFQECLFQEHSPFIALLWFLDIWHWFKVTKFIKLYNVQFILLLSSAQSVNKFFGNTPANKIHLQQNNITVKYDNT